MTVRRRFVHDMNDESPALHLIKHVSRHATEATGKSNIRVQQCYTEAIHLACVSGMVFDKDDFAQIAGYSGDIDRFYGAAVEAGNTSACLAIEQCTKRRPFFVQDGVQLVRGPSQPISGRLTVGSQIVWKGEVAKITSFGSGNLIACVYGTRKDNGDDLAVGKVVRRHTITWEQWKHQPKWLNTSGHAVVLEELLHWRGETLPVHSFSDDYLTIRLLKSSTITHGDGAGEKNTYVKIPHAEWLADLEGHARVQPVVSALEKSTTP